MAEQDDQSPEEEATAATLIPGQDVPAVRVPIVEGSVSVRLEPL